MRKLLLALFTAPVAVGCASSGPSAPIIYGNHHAEPPPSPVPLGAFANAPQAPLLADLRICGGTVSNVGPVSNDSRSLLFSSYIFAPSGALLRAPIEDGCLSSGFGLRDEATGGERQHTGIDLANGKGGFVFAAATGTVVSLGWRGDYGLTLELDHGQGVHTFYAHLSSIDPRLAPGSPVAAGAAVARMGATGNATGVHLHFEVSLYGLKLDPLRYGIGPPSPPAEPATIAASEDGQPPA
jgi:murein DD-endopeptidase MepM/ murein hydrolase activator NlpD